MNFTIFEQIKKFQQYLADSLSIRFKKNSTPVKQYLDKRDNECLTILDKKLDKKEETLHMSNYFIKNLAKTIAQLDLKSLSITPVKYRLVLDIDATMCQVIEEKHNKNMIDREWVTNNFPEGELIYWENSEYKYLHFCYPNFDKLVLSILSWDGWSVDIFPAGIAERNEAIIPQYFIKKFAKYSINPQENYADITKTGRLQIFSSHHMIDGEKNVGNKNQAIDNYEQYGRSKKDLTVISSDINNIVIADDDRSYILANQYPFIALSGSASSDFEDIIHYKMLQKKDLRFDPLKNADYIMGIILACKEMLDDNQANSLREALDLVLRHNGESVLRPEDGFSRNWDYSPWFIEPTRELSSARHIGESYKDTIYFNKMSEWIGKGSDYFDELF